MGVVADGTLGVVNLDLLQDFCRKETSYRPKVELICNNSHKLAMETSKFLVLRDAFW